MSKTGNYNGGSTLITSTEKEFNSRLEHSAVRVRAAVRKAQEAFDRERELAAERRRVMFENLDGEIWRDTHLPRRKRARLRKSRRRR